MQGRRVAGSQSRRVAESGPELRVLSQWPTCETLTPETLRPCDPETYSRTRTLSGSLSRTASVAPRPTLTSLPARRQHDRGAAAAPRGRADRGALLSADERADGRAAGRRECRSSARPSSWSRARRRPTSASASRSGGRPAARSAVNRTPTRARPFTLPARCASVTTPYAVLPAGSTARPPTYTVRTRLAVIGCSTREMSEPNDARRAKPEDRASRDDDFAVDRRRRGRLRSRRLPAPAQGSCSQSCRQTAARRRPSGRTRGTDACDRAS